MTILQSWDTACKGGALNDYSVCTTWGLDYDQHYLLDVWRGRPSYPDLKRMVLELFKKFGAHQVLIEDRSSGTPLLQDLAYEIWCLEPYKPEHGTDKLVRLSAQSVKFVSGNIHLPQDAPWLDEYVKEITGFPGCGHDDQVDSTTQALHVLGGMASSPNMYRFSQPVRESW
jgi:predicted phage terminase large subunit-like protein